MKNMEDLEVVYFIAHTNACVCVYVCGFRNPKLYTADPTQLPPHRTTEEPSAEY